MPRLPSTIPPTIRSLLTPQMCKPLKKAPIAYPVFFCSDGTEVQKTMMLREMNNYRQHIDGYDGARLVGYDLIDFEGKTYRKSTLALAGIFKCNTCHAYFRKLHNGQCAQCAGLVMQWMSSKHTPQGGWTRHGDSGPYFGLELEVEYPEHIGLIRRAFVESLVYDKRFPMVWTEDGSLSNGVEFNSYPMSRSYVEAVREPITTFLQQLVARGCSHKNSKGHPRAAVHVHVSKEAFCDNPTSNGAFMLWLQSHREALKTIGMRDEDSFHHWCDTPKDYCDARRGYVNPRDNTVEMRGFSAQVLLSDPADGLPKILDWITALAKASKTDPEEWIRMSPQALLRWGGSAYGGFPDEAKVSTDLWSTHKSRLEWERSKMEYCAALGCTAVRFHDDIRDGELRDVGLDPVRYAAVTRMVDYSRGSGGQRDVCFLFGANNERASMSVPWYFLQHATLPRPARSHS